MDAGYATLREMYQWAYGIIGARDPDFVIGERANPYMRRWWVVPRNEYCNIYLHEILRDDDDRAMHDHPWDSTSFILAGGYIEHTPEGVFVREPGSVVSRKATDMHRLQVGPGGVAVSLFVTGPKVREWGFDCPNGWRHWREFSGGEHGELVGRGCD